MSDLALEKYSKAYIFAEQKKLHKNSTGRFPPHPYLPQDINVSYFGNPSTHIFFFSFKANPESQRGFFKFFFGIIQLYKMIFSAFHIFA